ncbi:MAG: bacteriohemerythrin [Gammaproteobacteria bacterium]
MNPNDLEIFPWDDNFATGIEEIDVQHKRLVELLNELVGHLAYQSPAPTLNEVFEELKDYTVVHFATEEKIWNKHFKDDSWLEWHENAHGDFIANVLEFKGKVAEQSSERIYEELVSFLTSWLAMHIIESDKRMAKVVLALPSGISLERAKEIANQEMAGSTRVLINTVMGMYDKLANRTIQITREIGKRKEVENQLRTTQEELRRSNTAALESSAQKSAFLRNISYELRTPMSGVVGMTDLLLDTSMSDEQREMVETIYESAQTQLGILNDIVDFTRIETGDLTLTPTSFAFHNLVRTTIANLNEEAQRAGVSVHESVAANLPSPLRGDPLRIRQLLTNFVSNAIKFSSGLERRGTVEIDVRLAKREHTRAWVDISVRDNGIGMDKQTLDRIFRPFTQADASSTRKYGGTGLGLAISARLVEAMEGEIKVDSRPDEGSTFIARIPLLLDETQAEPAVADASDTASVEVPTRDQAIELGQLILVVEDNAMNQMVIQHQLAVLGYACDLAEDGLEGLERWRDGKYGLVITDLHMPNMDGYELARTIRAEEQTGATDRTPILALTANALSDEAERCSAVGMDGYMTKPMPLADLQAELEQWLSNSQPADTPPALSIMFVDDDTFMHELITSMLEGQGFADITCYANGEDALVALDAREAEPGAILLDINMPGMDGIEFVERLAERKYRGGLIPLSGEDEIMLRSTTKLAREVDLFVPGSIQKPPSAQRMGELLGQCTIDHPRAQTHPSSAARKTYDADAVAHAIDNGELINFYQPKVALPGGEWIGVETLVRWQHPRDGLVFPDQFIPTAEAHGLIGGVTRAVLKESIKQARRWRDTGLDLRVAVNVSMEDLTDMDFANFVIKEAASQQVPPESIVLEVTEGRLMQNFSIALHVLTRLRLKRFRLSIDDFGTGHSSLAQLRDLPFDELKIDQSFTHKAGEDARLRGIFTGSLEMANQLNMEVVVEGVEDDADWAFLLTTGSHVAQGYHIARPLPVEELAHWHEQWKQRLREG